MLLILHLPVQSHWLTWTLSGRWGLSSSLLHQQAHTKIYQELKPCKATYEDRSPASPNKSLTCPGSPSAPASLSLVAILASPVATSSCRFSFCSFSPSSPELDELQSSGFWAQRKYKNERSSSKKRAVLNSKNECSSSKNETWMMSALRTNLEC